MLFCILDWISWCPQGVPSKMPWRAISVSLKCDWGSSFNWGRYFHPGLLWSCCIKRLSMTIHMATSEKKKTRLINSTSIVEGCPLA